MHGERRTYGCVSNRLKSRASFAFQKGLRRKAQRRNYNCPRPESAPRDVRDVRHVAGYVRRQQSSTPCGLTYFVTNFNESRTRTASAGMGVFIGATANNESNLPF